MSVMVTVTWSRPLRKLFQLATGAYVTAANDATTAAGVPIICTRAPASAPSTNTAPSSRAATRTDPYSAVMVTMTASVSAASVSRVRGGRATGESSAVTTPPATTTARGTTNAGASARGWTVT